jgi:hypothetical protein
MHPQTSKLVIKLKRFICEESKYTTALLLRNKFSKSVHFGKYNN